MLLYSNMHNKAGNQGKNDSSDAKKLNAVDITECLLSCLNNREKDVIKRRHALCDGRRETLESIGEEYKITRERVRQIERASLNKIKRLIDYKATLTHLIAEIDKTIDKFGGIIAHHHLIDELLEITYEAESIQDEKKRNHLIFLLEQFVDEFFYFFEAGDVHKEGWSKDKDMLPKAKVTLQEIEEFLARHAKPKEADEVAKNLQQSVETIISRLHLSKKTDRNPFGSWGLTGWSEIKPKRMADRIYVVLEKYNEPLHYKTIANYISIHYKKKIHPPTVHNELIADSRFVLVGRGMYALKEWGYTSGTVREVVEQAVRQAKGPVTRDEIIKEVQKQRMVARSTILLAINKSKNLKRVGKESYTVTQ